MLLDSVNTNYKCVPFVHFLTLYLLSLGDRFWTSLTDEDQEGVWYWMTTLQLPVYTNWQPGQPDNGGAFYNEHCMTMNNPVGWGDTQCKDSWNAVCESR